MELLHNFSHQALLVLVQNHAAFFILVVPVIAVGEFGLIVPIFLESILLYAGFKISQGSLSYFFVVIPSLLGSVLGSSCLFYLSRLFGEKILIRFKFFVRRREQIESKIKNHTRWEPLTVTILRLTPGLFVPTTIFAGILDIAFGNFLAGVVAADLIYNLIFLSLGIILGKNAPLIASHLSFTIGLTLLVITIPAIFILYKYLVAPDRSNKD
jgi:membrane protein DedA with SNARE-associated domain